MKQNGFTLVELAIVLMIIGLLIGGILRGQEMMVNARNSATIQQVLSYGAASNTFMDKYSALPGDMMTATSRIPNCTSANNCNNGDSNGMIGTMDGGSQPWTSIDPSITSENTQFWKHLALAHLISGITPSAVTPVFGQSHPVSKNGAGFFVRYANFSGLTPGGTGSSSNHYLVLRRTIDGSWQCGGGGNLISLCAIAPKNASLIDRKMDDGVAGSGDVMAVSADWSNGCGNPGSGTNRTNGYDETAETNACDMMFKLN